MLNKWILIVFMLFCILAKGQPLNEISLNVQTYKIQNGLPSNNVNFVFQDYKGFIWIGTYTGLSKYNGFQFTNFLPNPNNVNSIKVGHYISFLKVSDSIYYLTTKLDGIQILNVNTNTLTHLKNSPSTPKNIMRDSDGNFWIGTLADGFYKYSPKNNTFKKFVLKPLTKNFSENWDNNTINEIAINNQNKNLLWLGCRNGLYSFNKTTNKCKQFKAYHPSSMHNFALNQITSVLQDKDGTIWAGKFFGGIGKLNVNTGKWEHYYFNPSAFNLKVLNTNIIDNLKFINTDSISISTNNGPMIFNKITKLFTKINLINNTLKVLGDVVDYFTDKDGNLWFSNQNQNGLALASKRLNATKQITFPKQIFKPDYYGSIITDLFWSNQSQCYFLSATNHDGILVYDKQFNLLKQVSIPSNWEEKEPFATSIGQDKEAAIWITDITNQLIKYEPSKNKMYNYSTTFFKNCYQIIRSDNQELFYHTDKGLYKHQKNSWSLVFPNTSFNVISNVKNNKLFLIDNLNIYEFNIGKKTKKLIFTLPKFAIEKGNYIQNITIDSKNRLWIPLEFGGVYMYSINTKTLKLFSFNDGLTNNTTREVKEDKNGRIFILCNGGFFYYDEVKNLCIDFDNLTHQNTNDWYEHCLFFSENNEVIVCKDNALYIIDENMVLKSASTKPYFTDIYSQNLHYINGFNHINIPNYQNDLKIYFTNFDYSNANEMVYEYSLSSLSDKWFKLDKGINYISFTNLKEGKYILRVRVKGNKNFAECTFNINTQWYKNKWFYIIVTVLFITFILGTVWYYFNKKSKEKELQKRIAELKLASLQSQLNPHFLFNCLTSIAGLIKTKEYNKSEKILTDFANLMRSILINSSKDLILLSEEIKISKLYLEIEQIRKANTFNYIFQLPENINLDYKIPPLILQPFLENCIKHGFIHKNEENKGLINIIFEKNNTGIIIKIKDNGIGLESKKTNLIVTNKHNSMGIELQKERLKQYYETYKITMDVQTIFEENKGATILITIQNNT